MARPHDDHPHFFKVPAPVVPPDFFYPRYAGRRSRHRGYRSRVSRVIARFRLAFFQDFLFSPGRVGDRSDHHSRRDMDGRVGGGVQYGPEALRDERWDFVICLELGRVSASRRRQGGGARARGPFVSPTTVHCSAYREWGREMPRANFARHARQEPFRESPRPRGRNGGSDRSHWYDHVSRPLPLSSPNNGHASSPTWGYCGNGGRGLVPARILSSFLFYSGTGERATPTVVVRVPMWAANGRKSQADSGALVSLRQPFSSSWLG